MDSGIPGVSKTGGPRRPHSPRALRAPRMPAWAALCLQLLAMTALALVMCSPARAQNGAAFKDEELDQMLAPIALYPDSLLSQVLMAATYPSDVKAAAAWSKAHPDAKGDAALKQVENQPWEPAVQSLVAFPQVLAMMDERPDDVQKLGDAFLDDPGRVMDRVQFLRQRAQAAGNLQSNSQQKISTAPAAAGAAEPAIVIEPAQPSQVYVPVYQPSVVYGPWMYPAYPPVYWPPPPLYYPGAAFAAGFVWGAAVVGINNALWGGFGWNNRNVNINVNRFNSVNVNRRISANNNHFTHNPARRGNTPYRTAGTRDRFGGGNNLAGAGGRENFRGKDNRAAERNRAQQTLANRGADPAAGRARLQGADRDRASAAARNTGAADRARNAGGSGRLANAGAGDRARGAGASGNRSQLSNVGHNGSGARDNAFSGIQNSGTSRASAQRGQASRAASAPHRAAPSRSFSGGGGARMGGGGARMGGGGRRR